MNKAFTREVDDAGDDDDVDGAAQPLPSGSKNYITVQGYQRLRAELLLSRSAWATASSGRCSSCGNSAESSANASAPSV